MAVREKMKNEDAVKKGERKKGENCIKNGVKCLKIASFGVMNSATFN